MGNAITFTIILIGGIWLIEYESAPLAPVKPSVLLYDPKLYEAHSVEWMLKRENWSRQGVRK